MEYLLQQEGIDHKKPGHGTGRDTIAVGLKYAPQYRLRAEEVSEEQAREAINLGRSVVVSFYYKA